MREGLVELKSPIKFLILASLPIMHPDESVKANGDPSLITIASLHIMGELDHVLPQSLRLISNFTRPLVVFHPLAHQVPKQFTKQQFDKIRRFIGKSCALPKL